MHITVIAISTLVLICDAYDALGMGYVAPAMSDAWQLAKGEFAPVFASGLLGLMVGAIILGPLADMFGGRAMILCCLFLFGTLTLLTVTISTVESLTALRFATGVTLGGALPNIIALTSEFMPLRRRTLIATILAICFNLGAAIAGFCAAALIPHYGWQSVFWLGGLFPLLVLPFVWRWLPESLYFMVRKEKRRGDLVATLKRIDPELVFEQNAIFVVPEERPKGFPVKQLFTEGRGILTILVWVFTLTHTGALWFVNNWVPTLVHNAGFSISQAASSTAIFQFGGILGALALGVLVDWKGLRVIAVATVGATILIALIGILGTSVAIIFASSFAAGALVVGTTQCWNGYTGAVLYTGFIRSTGAAWAIAAGRLGAVLIGSLAAGWLVHLNLSQELTFMVGASPEVIAAITIYALFLVQAQRLRQQYS
jgi:AAHS family 4-hydroxybenzoate transporter-like MFS transporter